jgi:hypothetical protein
MLLLVHLNSAILTLHVPRKHIEIEIRRKYPVLSSPVLFLFCWLLTCSLLALVHSSSMIAAFEYVCCFRFCREMWWLSWLGAMWIIRTMWRREQPMEVPWRKVLKKWSCNDVWVLFFIFLHVKFGINSCPDHMKY